jgi:hypothetical protein
LRDVALRAGQLAQPVAFEHDSREIPEPVSGNSPKRDVVELALQHAVKAGQLTARQFAALIRQNAKKHRESALNGREVRIRA